MRAVRCNDDLSSAFSGFPVDVWQRAGQLGIVVLETAWRGLPHALCLYPERIIVLNGLRSLTSRRFDLAHELGHYVLGVEHYHTSAANLFAAELLMPAAVFKLEVLVAGGVTDGVCQMFGVSRAAAQLRVKQLREVI